MYVPIAVGAVAALIAIYMVRPHFIRVVQSAVRFFPNQPVASDARLWSWSRPRPTPLFFVQVLVVALLFSAIFAHALPPRAAARSQIGVWVLLDRSASMSTVQAGRTRILHALDAIRRIAEQPSSVERCFRLSAFDLRLTPVQEDLRTGDALIDAARTIAIRPLGTDLTLVQRALSAPTDAARGCRVDQAIVISDTPAPAWMDAPALARHSWIDVSQPVSNVGFTQIDSVRDQLTGGVAAVRLRVGAFGGGSEPVTLVTELPDGTRRTSPLTFADAAHVEELALDREGVYRFRLAAGGAYAYDDQVEIHVPAVDDVRVDWQIAARRLPESLGWVHDPGQPDLRVLAEAPPDEVPAIVVGPGYAPGAGVHPILDFHEVSPLLASLNLDVAERIGMSAAPSLPGFEPVLRGAGGVVWLAQRSSPPAAYVPGLPLPGDGTAARFSAAAFFNAVKWVLQRRVLPPLFRLTSPEDPEPHGNVLALHPGEGDTGRAPRSLERSSMSFDATALDVEPRHLWPWLLLAAMAAFAAERWLALVRGWT